MKLQIRMRLCWFCYEDGENVEAVARYYAKTAAEWYDVCAKHLEPVKKDGLKFEAIKGVEEFGDE